jgi:hypothetical protein
MTYNAWLAKEKELDNAFRIWKETGNGKREIAEVYARFPGLRLTSMGSDDVSWFVREMSTPGTLLRKMWDDSTSNKDTESGFSVIQMKLLLLLTSPERCLGPTAMWCEWEHLFPFYRGRTDLLWSMVYSGGPIFRGDEQTNGYHCLFPHYGYLEGNILSWPVRPNCAVDVLPFRYHQAITLPPGEESMIFTNRYELHEQLYRDAPPYIAESCIYPGKTANGLSDMPAELLNKIFKNVGLFEGPVLMALSFRIHSDDRICFRCRLVPPSHRAWVGGIANYDWTVSDLDFERIPKVLYLRHVCRIWGDMILDVFFQNTFVFQYERTNLMADSRSQDLWIISTSMREDRYNLANFNIRFIPVMENEVTRPLVEADGIGFTYEEESVHLGASCDADRMVFGTDSPWYRISDRTKINDQLFRDSNGQLIVRAFRLRFNIGTPITELSTQWVSDIFQCLHQRGIAGKQDSGNTLVLGRNAESK